MRRRLAQDRRAQSSGMIVFALIIAVSALLWALADPAASQLFSVTTNLTTSPDAQAVIDERQTIWNNILFFPLLLAGLFLLTRAILQSRGP